MITFIKKIFFHERKKKRNNAKYHDLCCKTNTNPQPSSKVYLLADNVIIFLNIHALAMR